MCALVCACALVELWWHLLHLICMQCDTPNMLAICSTALTFDIPLSELNREVSWIKGWKFYLYTIAAHHSHSLPHAGLYHLECLPVSCWSQCHQNRCPLLHGVRWVTQHALQGVIISLSTPKDSSNGMAALTITCGGGGFPSVDKLENSATSLIWTVHTQEKNLHRLICKHKLSHGSIIQRHFQLFRFYCMVHYGSTENWIPGQAPNAFTYMIKV